METRDPPSLANKIFGPPFFLASGIAALLWFFYRVIFLIQNISEPTVTFDKGSYYMLGVGIGLLSLGFVTALEFWGGKPITSKQNSILSKSAISGVLLLFVVLTDCISKFIDFSVINAAYFLQHFTHSNMQTCNTSTRL